MSIYRHVHTDFWQDAFILELTPEEKYFYIYLLTNSKTKQCGIYELPSRIIETETGYNRETVEKLLNRFEEYEKIVYDKNSKEMYLKNWIKHNKMTSIKVRKCVEKELQKVKSQDIINQFLSEASKYGYEIDFATQKLNTKESTKQSNIPNETNNIKGYVRLYEDNVGIINGVVKDWLVEISKTIDLENFKKAIQIATDKGKCNKGYINGIINQWIEKDTKHKGDKTSEDESIYSKPTTEQLEEARKLLDEI